jgi:hypothetical protein
MTPGTYHERALGAWGRITPSGWDEYTPPWRPSAGDIRNYLAALRPLKPRKVLILGSTPELRRLAASLGARATVVDLSDNMLREMGKLLPPRARAGEKRLRADWLRAPLGVSEYDAVLGDLSLRLVEPRRQPALLRRLRACLKSSGRFITRVHFVNHSLPGRPALGIFRRTMRTARRSGNPFYLPLLIRSRLFDAGTWRRDMLKLCALARAGSPAEKWTAKILLEKMRAPARFHSQTRVELDARLRRCFTIEKKLRAADYDDSGYYPVYSLRPDPG